MADKHTPSLQPNRALSFPSSLRVVFCSLAPSLFFSAGGAGWSKDGIGCGASSVDSRLRFMLFGLVLWSGFMPLGSLPSDLASRIRWPFSSSSTAPSSWRQRDGSGSGESPLNKLAVALGDAAVVLLPFPLSLPSCGGRGSGGESQQVQLQQCLSSSDLYLLRGWSPSLLSRRFSGFSFLCMFLQQMRSGGVDADGMTLVTNGGLGEATAPTVASRSCQQSGASYGRRAALFNPPG